MTKQNPYAVPRRFQQFFIVLGGLAYIASTLPYIDMMFQQRAAFDSAANTILLVGTMIIPLLIAAGAAALTRRRGLGRAWVATGAAYLGVVTVGLLMWLGSVIFPWQYEVANIIALVIAVVVVMAAVWIDRQQPLLSGKLRHWRIASVVGLYAATVVTYLVDAMRSVPYSQPAGADLQSLMWFLLALTAFVVLTVAIFRRMPVVERMKRVVLMIAVIMLTGMVVGGVISVAQLNQMDSLTPIWLGLSLLGVAYVLGIRLLRPAKITGRAVRRK